MLGESWIGDEITVTENTPLVNGRTLLLDRLDDLWNSLEGLWWCSFGREELAELRFLVLVVWWVLSNV